MDSKNLQISDPSYVAEFVRNSEFESVREARLAVPPDHMAMLMRDGELVDVYRGANFSLGGMLARIRAFLGGRHSFSLLLASLRPFAVQLDFRMIAKDHVEVSGVAHLELQVDPDKPGNVLGLMTGQLPLSRSDILRRVSPHFTERVFASVGARIDSDKLRGNVGVQDLIQGDIMRETERVLGDLGIIAKIVSVEFALTDTEKAELSRAAIEREQQRLDFALAVSRRETERNADSKVLEVRSRTDLAKLEIASEDELNQMVLRNELEFADARETGQRIQEMKALQHEIEVLRTENLAKFENELAHAGHSVGVQRQRLELKKVELEMQKLGRLQAAEMTKLEHTDKLEIAARANAVAADNIRALQDIELHARRSESEMRILEHDSIARRDLEKSKLEAQARVDFMRAGADMTPEQILAVNAGLSADVAKVLSEQARAKAAEGESTMALMREFVDRAREDRITTAEQAHALAGKALASNVGVARRTGARETGTGADVGPSGEAESVECPKCGRSNSARSRFCIGCGNQLRT